MKRPSIKLALILLFGAMSFAAVGQGAFALLKASEIGAAADRIGSDALNGVDLAHQLDSATAEFRLLEVNHLQAMPGPQTQAAEAALDAFLIEYDGIKAAFKAQMSSDGEVTNFASFEAHLADYMAMHQQLRVISATGMQQDQAETLFAGGMLSLYQQMTTDLQGMVEANKGIGAQALTNAQNAYASAVTASVLVMAVIAAAGAASIWFAITGIARPIESITLRMSKLAEGDTAAPVPYVGRQDELGDMAAAVQVFRENGIKVAEMSLEEGARAKLNADRARMMGSFQAAFDTVIAATAQGDFSKRIDARFDDKDIDRISANFNGMLQTVNTGLAEAGSVLAALAQADLTKRMEGSYQGAFAQLRDDMNAVGDKLTDIVGQLRGTSGALKSATGEILAGTNDLAERTTKQAAAIEETSAAMEQLATTVVENAKRAGSASSKAQGVSHTAAETGEVMRQSNQAMERISSSSAKISNIIGLIDDIAFQTNLLALNASVEAARAGDAGKGFAVVAIEVRRLAQSAAHASDEVKALIEQSANDVANGTRMVPDASSALSSMLEGMRESSTLITEIAGASEEQSQAIAEVSVAVRQMDEMTQRNAALVEQTNAAIEQTENQARTLDNTVEVFVLDARPATAAKTGVEPMPRVQSFTAKAKTAARTFLSRGNAAIAQDWSEF